MGSVRPALGVGPRAPVPLPRPGLLLACSLSGDGAFPPRPSCLEKSMQFTPQPGSAPRGGTHVAHTVRNALSQGGAGRAAGRGRCPWEGRAPLR